MASAVDRIQHQSAVASDHSHLPFSDIIVETSDHQHEANSTASDDRESAPDQQPGTGHHHHGDSGSGMLASLPHGSSWVFSRGSSWRPATDDGAVGFLIYGPERPPKGSVLHI